MLSPSKLAAYVGYESTLAKDRIIRNHFRHYLRAIQHEVNVFQYVETIVPVLDSTRSTSVVQTFLQLLMDAEMKDKVIKEEWKPLIEAQVLNMSRGNLTTVAKLYLLVDPWFSCATEPFGRQTLPDKTRDLRIQSRAAFLLLR